MNHTNEVQLIENDGWDERILVCRNGSLVDTTIVVSSRYVVVVDTMINEVTAEALMAVAAPYLSDERTLLVVNTHADYDHCWGNQLFAAQGAPIIGQRKSVPIFAQAGSLEFLERVRMQEPEIFGEVRFTPPTILLDEALTIDGGDLTLELFATPGHTVDHISIYLPEIGTVLVADAAEFPYPMARTAEGLPEMRRSLERLAALDADTFLYCHAPLEMGRKLLEENIAYFERLEEACRAAVGRGVAPDVGLEVDIIELVGLPYAAAVPDNDAWQNVHDFYRTGGHAQQLGHMMASLARV